MTTHSSILAWRIPWIAEPGGLQSTGLQSRTQLKRQRTHTPGALPGPGIKPVSPVPHALRVDASPAEPLGKSLTFKVVFIGVWLIYNAMFISTLQQSESVTLVHMSAFIGAFPNAGHCRALHRVSCALL